MKGDGVMMKLLSFIRQKLIWFITGSMVSGLVVGSFFNVSFLKSWILPLTILMIYPMMVTLNIKSVFSGCNYRLEGFTQSINFILIPLIAFVIGQLFFADQPLTALGLFLIALLPTSGMTISWTGFAKGNVAAAIKMTIIGLILGGIATPLYIQTFMGAAVSISVDKIIQQILIVIFIPLILGFLTQTLLITRFGKQKFQSQIKPVFPSFSTLGVIGIIFSAIALKAKAIIANPLLILNMILPLVLFYGINFLIISLIGKRFFSREDAIAMVYGSAIRNLSLALAIAVIAFGDQGLEIALIVAVAYVIQAQAAAGYLRVADRIFGRADQAALAIEGKPISPLQ
jgi:ACR3 family arsenite efflux pump ArsB